MAVDVHSVTPKTLDGLRAHGFSDADILDAVHVCGYYNYLTRLVDALGIDPDPDMPPKS